MISCDDVTGFLYVGDRDKPYHSLQELVQEGLTTLYLDLKAGCYIDLMCDLTNFHNGSSSALKNGHSRFNYSSSRKNSSSPSPSASTASRSSIVSWEKKTFEIFSVVIYDFDSYAGLSMQAVYHVRKLWVNMLRNIPSLQKGKKKSAPKTSSSLLQFGYVIVVVHS